MKKSAGILGMTLAAVAALAADIPLNQRQARISPEWVTGGAMYQIQPRAFTPEGTLKAAEARLPRLSELGVTVLYLCPVFVADDDMDQAFWSPTDILSERSEAGGAFVTLSILGPGECRVNQVAEAYRVWP